jgi:hypothetical protein
MAALAKIRETLHAKFEEILPILDERQTPAATRR